MVKHEVQVWRRQKLADIIYHFIFSELSFCTLTHLRHLFTMPIPSMCTFRGLDRDGFAGDPEPVEGSHHEICDQDQELCQRYRFPNRRPDYSYRYMVVPSAAAERTNWPRPPAPVEDQEVDNGWRNRLLGRFGLKFRRKPKELKWYDLMEERLEDEDVKYECVERRTPTTWAFQAYTSGQSPHHPGPWMVENRFIVDVDGDRRPPNKEDMRIWREYVEDCEARGQKPDTSVPVQGGTLRKMF